MENKIIKHLPFLVVLLRISFSCVLCALYLFFSAYFNLCVSLDVLCRILCAWVLRGCLVPAAVLVRSSREKSLLGMFRAHWQMMVQQLQ